MKNLFLLIIVVFLLTSCNKETITNETNELVAITLKGKPDKISICHYNPHNDTYKTISVNENQLARHLEHGDLQRACDASPIYLDDNGVTVKCYDWANVGDTGEINEITYTIVDESMLRQMVNNAEDVTKVCTTKVTNMSRLFYNFNPEINGVFNQNIASWDVSNVTDMSEMFYQAWKFNQPIGNWDVSNVTDMSGMFKYHYSFVQDISSWDVSSVIDMSEMLSFAYNFNQPIGNWNVSSVTDMSGMLSNAYNFNQPIGNWNVSSVTDMSRMFSGATAFNQPIGNWDVSGVTDMGDMFNYARVFNQPIGNWNVSSVTTMLRMFPSVELFDQDLSGWNVTNVIECQLFSDNTPQWRLPKPNFTNCTE